MRNYRLVDDDPSGEAANGEALDFMDLESTHVTKVANVVTFTHGMLTRASSYEMLVIFVWVGVVLWAVQYEEDPVKRQKPDLDYRFDDKLGFAVH